MNSAIDKKLLRELALSDYEYSQICDKLGREPNELELGLFAALWSEHCGYKHTKHLIRQLPSRSERTLTASGAENAGAVDIGDGLAVVMKVESHNHPSAITPYEGAATGVGGVVRDIMAMGARPIALLNSLRFGDPRNDQQRYLLNGVISGIADYGNCIGVPDVGGEIVFDDVYAGNPLVNAMCVGIVKIDELVSARAEAGNLLVLVGSDTGKDGIHGASTLASRTFGSDTGSSRSAVQVGNPFLEKTLIESCLEAIKLKDLVGIQDCGAAGLTSAAIEMAGNSNLGLDLNVATVPTREANMTPYEIMLSESQERMLLAVTPGGFDELSEIFMKWDLQATVIGKFNKSELVNIYDGEARVASAPVKALTSPPEYLFESPRKPEPPILAAKFSKEPPPLEQVLTTMLGSLNICSRRAIYQQFDQHVQTRTVIEPGGDAALLKLHEGTRGLALSIDCNGRQVAQDPFVGTQMAVAEACRNLVVSGATPIALTNGLNFGDPQKEEVQYQLINAIKGMSQASEALRVPIISGNASMFNEASEQAIYPTPIIGALGLLENISKYVTMGFKRDGDVVVIIGSHSPWDKPASLIASQYERLYGRNTTGELSIDMELESSVQRVCLELIDNGILNSAHDCSDGGAAIALAECCIAGNIGVKVDTPLPDEVHAGLFGESPSRIVVSLDPTNISSLGLIVSAAGVPWNVVGTVGGKLIQFADLIALDVKRARDIWENGLDEFI